MDTIQTIKTGIVAMLQEKGNGLSFVNLSAIPGFAGDTAIELGSKNIFFWFHCSAEAVEAIAQLVDERVIEILSTSPLTYHADGQLPPYQLATSWKRSYVSPRWAPAQIVKGKAFA